MQSQPKKYLSLLTNWLCSALVALHLGGCAPPVNTKDLGVHRNDLYYVYFGSNSSQLAETSDHIKGHMVTLWWGADQQIADAVTTYQIGMPVFILSTPSQDEAAITADLQRYKAVGIDPTAIIHDEPEINGFTHEQIMSSNAITKQVIQKLGLTTKLGVIYSAAAFGKWQGISSYDWVGFDNYGGDIFKANGDYSKLKKVLTPTQRIILVPGGATPWKEDPKPFQNAAENDPQVVLIMPFIWFDNADPAHGVGAGIRSNGMSEAYKAVGLRIKQAR